MSADELRPTCGCEQGMGHMDPGCHSYGLCHVQSAERAARPVRGPAGNPRRLAWFTDDELVAELERRAPGNGGGAAVRDALLKHHPIADTMTGPLKGCHCGQVGIGQDVIAHVAAELRAALAPQAGERGVCCPPECGQHPWLNR